MLFQYQAGPRSSYAEIVSSENGRVGAKGGGSWITGVDGPSGWVRSTTCTPPSAIAPARAARSSVLDMPASSSACAARKARTGTPHPGRRGWRPARGGARMGDDDRGSPAVTSTRRLPVTTAAEALLATLKARGIDHLLANPGTDFAPIIEGFARAPSAGLPVPTPVAITHEAAAIAMAHGHWLASGRPLALMVHVNVGLAHTLMGVINAARDNVPLLLLSGRTPIGEGRDRLGARDLPIHWGQEMRDQGGMLRELVKWDYEL